MKRLLFITLALLMMMSSCRERYVDSNGYSNYYDCNHQWYVMDAGYHYRWLKCDLCGIEREERYRGNYWYNAGNYRSIPGGDHNTNYFIRDGKDARTQGISDVREDVQPKSSFNQSKNTSSWSSSKGSSIQRAPSSSSVSQPSSQATFGLKRNSASWGTNNSSPKPSPSSNTSSWNSSSSSKPSSTPSRTFSGSSSSSWGSASSSGSSSGRSSSWGSSSSTKSSSSSWGSKSSSKKN